MSWGGWMTLAAALHLYLVWQTRKGWLSISVPPSRNAAPPDACKLTVITAARNEALNLPQWLQAIENQTLRPAAIVLADDRSDDESLRWMDEHSTRNSALKIVRIHETPAGWSPKKYALTQAIAAAPTDFLALTDADCEPRLGWLVGISNAFEGGAQWVLGYSPYRKSGKKWLDRMIGYETFHTAFLYFGEAAAGRPWMGVGRNIAYHKCWFEAQNGFAGHRDRLSGDDDLLIAQAQSNRNSAPSLPALLLASDTWVDTDAPQNWREWVKQKRRHVGASLAYPLGIQMRLAAYFLSFTAIYGLILAAILSFSLSLPHIVIFMAYSYAKWKAMRFAAWQLEFRSPILRWMVNETLLLCYCLFLVPLGWLQAAPPWK